MSQVYAYAAFSICRTKTEAQRNSHNFPHRLCVNTIPSDANQSPVLDKFLIILFGCFNLPLNNNIFSSMYFEITHSFKNMYSGEKYPPSLRHLGMNRQLRQNAKKPINPCRPRSLSSHMVAFIPAFLREPYWLRGLPTTSGLLLAGLCLQYQRPFVAPWPHRSRHLTNAKRSRKI